MTVYSQHVNRGKVQILATYKGKAGVTSSTVTSVDSAATAAPIIDALNRISECATLPVSVRDRRTGSNFCYPDMHLEAITDRNRRADLLTGTHSLWYEYTKLLLHRALIDLDATVTSVPAPVRTAIEAELDAEVRNLRAALLEYKGRSPECSGKPERLWDFEEPFVPFEGGMEELNTYLRESFDRAEDGLSDEELDQAVSDLRILYSAYTAGAGDFTRFQEDYLLITHDPEPHGPSPDSYLLDIQAPMLSYCHGPTSWTVTINQWDIDPEAPQSEDELTICSPVLDCALRARPTESELVNLLRLSRKGQQGQLSAWAKTPVGVALSGTSFVVTRRYHS